MILYGPIGSCITVWRCMDPYDPVWPGMDHMTPYGHGWLRMAPYGQVCPGVPRMDFMALYGLSGLMYGIVWKLMACMALNGTALSRIVPYVPVWSRMVPYGPKCYIAHDSLR